MMKIYMEKKKNKVRGIEEKLKVKKKVIKREIEKMGEIGIV